MQFLQNSRRIIARLLKPIIIPEANPRSVSSVSQIPGPFQWPNNPSPSSVLNGCLHTRSSSFSLLIPSSSFSSEAGDPTGCFVLIHVILETTRVSHCIFFCAVTVKELHDKILESVNVKRSVPPNAWLWSLIESCQCQDDINLLFEVLQKLRRFVTTLKNNAPLRWLMQLFVVVGKKALWKHNVLGLTPSVASAHHLLALADSLKSVIPSMVNALLSSGLNVRVDLDELYKKDDLLS
ncbi:hypothetical protein Bca52824_075363 [Brassica carinata]|uniref:Uncharacterized protein n=1 Tax=Brassica carinata TaxID=52824 RepID=A0A8X7PPG5_BRACI|nr:hypothetical protein Bca52824_075363 [Brassica carinata]